MSEMTSRGLQEAERRDWLSAPTDDLIAESQHYTCAKWQRTQTGAGVQTHTASSKEASLRSTYQSFDQTHCRSPNILKSLSELGCQESTLSQCSPDSVCVISESRTGGHDEVIQLESHYPGRPSATCSEYRRPPIIILPVNMEQSIPTIYSALFRHMYLSIHFILAYLLLLVCLFN